MPQRFRIGRLRKNYGRKEQKESLSLSSNESSETSTQSSSPTGSSLSTENVNPIVDIAYILVLIAIPCQPIVTWKWYKKVNKRHLIQLIVILKLYQSEVSTSINASSVTVSDDEGVTALDNDQSLEGDTNLSLEVLTSQLKLPNQQWVIQQQTECGYM